MRQRRFLFPLLAVVLATAPNLAPQSSNMQEKIGKLTKLTDTEIDINCFDQGQTVTIVFVLAPGAKSPQASLGQTVNVTFYLNEKHQKIAKSFTVYTKALNPSAPGSGKYVEPSAVSESVPPSPQGISADTQQAAASSTASSQQSASSVPQQSASAGGPQPASAAASSASEQASAVAASENPPSVASSSSSSGLDGWGKILPEFSLTKTTADKSDIVTAGSVLVLHKDGLVMFSTPTAAPPTNVYKNGRLQRNEMKDQFKGLGFGRGLGKNDCTVINRIPHRTFVAGEKFWVTGVDVKPDGLVLTVYSDPFNDIRYYGQITFPYPKNSPPPTSEMAKTVEEVVTVAKDDEDKASTVASASAPATAMRPFAPPPPPVESAPPSPKTIKVGQTKEEVVAAYGQPTKTVKLGNKEIYYYPDMKVIFVGGKVTDVQ